MAANEIPGWAYRPEIIDYIVESYAGVEVRGDVGRNTHRVFIWEDSENIVMGNTIAFSDHLRTRFGLLASARSICSVLHKVMRELGEEAKKGWTVTTSGDHIGEYKPPVPEIMVIGHAGDPPHPSKQEND